GFDEEGSIREAALVADRWCSYIAMAKLLDMAAPRAATIDVARRPRADSLTIRFRPVESSDAAALRAWELALLSTPPALLKLPDEIAAPERFGDELAAVLANPANFLVAAVIDVDGA